MPDDEHKQPPKTVAEIGIHVGYIREDLQEIKDVLRNSPSRKEHDELVLRVEKLETLIDKVKSKIALTATTIFVGMVLALYGLDKWFKG